MANVEKLQFPALKITGGNYIAWTTDVELHLESDKLSETIKEKNESSPQEKAKAIIFLRKHLDENLMHDYAQIKDPSELCKALKERFDNQRAITLPHALDDWANLRFQDFEKVEAYNSAMLRIVNQLAYCGKPVSEAEMLNKTYLTFHKNHYVLQEQYRNCGYKRFSDLMVALMIAETNSQLLIKNHNARPAGSKAFPEVNAMVTKYPEHGNQSYQGRGRGRGQGRGQGRGRRFNRGRGRSYTPYGRKPYMIQKEEFSKRKEPHKTFTQRSEEICYKCGSKGHWFRVCRTPEHLCKLYKESLKGKEKEVNLMEQSEGSTHLDASDFAGDFDTTAHMEE